MFRLVNHLARSPSVVVTDHWVMRCGRIGTDPVFIKPTRYTQDVDFPGFMYVKPPPSYCGIRQYRARSPVRYYR